MMPSSWSKYSRCDAITRAPSGADAITRNWLKAVVARQRGNLVDVPPAPCPRRAIRQKALT